MPIRPEMKSRYPANWAEIRAQILARAGDRCERCGKANGATVFTVRDGSGCWYDPIADEWYDRNGVAINDDRNYDLDGLDWHEVRVVLTIAHWPDPTPENCSDDNLWALCQACHLRLDIDTHVSNNRATRRARKACGSLPHLEVPQCSS